ncbi:MAG: hypothetical protein AAFP81_10040 [Pseudomonadota bacterium]
MGRWVFAGAIACLLIGVIVLIQPSGFLNSQIAAKTDADAVQSVETDLKTLRELLADKKVAEMQSVVAGMEPINNAEQKQRFDEMRRDAFEVRIEELLAEIDSREGETKRKLQFLRLHVRSAKSAFIVTEQGVASIEQKAIELVRPVPASDAITNAAGYRLLAMLRPDNQEYAEKLSAYKATIAQQRQEQRKAERAERDRREAAKLAARRKPLEDKRRAILSKYRLETDKFSKTTFYTHKNSPRFLNTRSTAYLYIGIKNDRPYLRMKIIYTAGEWLFFTRAQVFADGDVRTLYSGNWHDIDRDNGSSKVWEWVDVSPTTAQISALRLISTASEATIRYDGRDYRKDVNMSRADRIALKDILADYEELEEILSELRSIR